MTTTKIDKTLWLNDIPKKEWWTWDRIKPYPYNARTHPPAQVALLQQLIVKYGPDQPIIVDEDALILKGHGRRLSTIDILDGFWVKQRFGLSEVDKRAMRLQDNAAALMAGWDNELVRFEIEALKRSAYPIELLGFGEAQLVSFTTVPGPPAGGFQTFGEDIPVTHQCPKCGYVGSGNWAPTEAKPAKKAAVPGRKARTAKAAKKKK